MTESDVMDLSPFRIEQISDIDEAIKFFIFLYFMAYFNFFWDELLQHCIMSMLNMVTHAHTLEDDHMHWLVPLLKQ